MTWREQFEMMVGIYVSAMGLGEGKPLSMRRLVIEEGFKVTRDLVGNMEGPFGNPRRAAYDFVSWKLGVGDRPAWHTV